MANRRDYKDQWIRANRIKVAFQAQRAAAKARCIPFLLTFEEWWAIWQASGMWAEKGMRKHQYCMARTGDKGAYAVGNVRICTMAENRMEQAANITPETRRRMAQGTKSHKSYERTPEIRRKMSIALKARPPFSEEWRRNISEGRKRLPPISEETRCKLRASQQARRARERHLRPA